MGGHQVECTIPVLPVANLAASVTFYCEVLGFRLDWGDPAAGCVASVSRDGHPLMLMVQPGQFAPVWVWIGLESASLFDEFRANGAKVRQEPRNFSWAYEMKFEDPDRNILWMGTEPRGDLPQEDR